jgi:hypothetical protein
MTLREREGTSDGVSETWHMPRQDHVDLVIVGAVWHRIDRDDRARRGEARDETLTGPARHRPIPKRSLRCRDAPVPS